MGSERLDEIAYKNLSEILECPCIDITTEFENLPAAEMVIANLLIEYVEYDAFQMVLKHVSPRYVSCVIQIDEDDEFVSESPYLKSFEKLNEIHHHIHDNQLTNVLKEEGYNKILSKEYPLPNGKKLIRLDYVLE